MKYIKLLFILITCIVAHAQVGIGTTTPDASSVLDITSTDKGLLIPRVSIGDTSLAAPVVTPATGLLIYNTNAAITGGDGVGFYYWNGTQWTQFTTSGKAWELTGNSGTNPTTNFVGTSDSQDLVFRTNNIENMRINTDGNVGIGTTSNQARLYVNIPTSNNTTNYGIYNYHNGTDPGTTYGIRNLNYTSTNSTKYGIYNNTNSEGTGAHYGIFNQTYMNPSSNATGYGAFNYLNAYGTGNHRASYNYLNLSGSAVGTQNYASYNLMNVSTSTNTSTIYGEYTDVDFSSGPSYGEYKEMNSNAAYSSLMYGDYNQMQGTGNGTSYAVYNNFANTGSGAKYGMRNEFGNVPGTKYGVYNYFPNGTATGTIYGTYNNITNDANATKYGTRNYINGGAGSLRGSYNQIYPSSTNISAIYGLYSYVSSAGTGTHYGIYSNTPGGTNDYSGMFYAGNFVANEVGGNYDFRVESDTNTNMFFLDASTNRVGIGTAVPSDELTVNGWIGRTAHNNGGLVGSYNSVGANAAQTNPIYVIGSNYKPAATTLNNMYGTGYTHTNANFITDPGPNTWGMYVAADGDARIWLGASAGGYSYFNAGNVGFGTTTPTQARLVVNGTSASQAIGNHGYLNNTGATGTNTTAKTYSIWATSRIAATEFNAFSDERIKNIKGVSNSKKDLDILSQIEVTNYQLKDTIIKGSQSLKKVIAQQVKNVYPQAVTDNVTEVIPNIYKLSEIKDGWIQLATNLQKGDIVKLIFSEKEEVLEVLEVSKKSFKVSSEQQGKVFVYGKEVNDFHTVDYEAISMLNVSATQELLKRIKVLEYEKEVLTEALKQNKEDTNKRLSAIEQLLTIESASKE